MEMFKDKVSVARNVKLAAGIGILLAATTIFWRGQLALGFLTTGFGLSVIVMAEGEFDLSKKHDLKSFWQMLRSRTEVSTLGKLCDITAHFCYAAALISWLVLR